MIKFAKYLYSSFSNLLFHERICCHGNKPRINGWSVIGSNLVVGNNVHFNGVRTYGRGCVEIGDNFHSSKGLIILTQNHNFMGESIPYGRGIVVKNVCIAENVWIGMNVLILPGVTIGEGAIVQAGSVVSKSIPALAIAGGNPATVFKYRDENHYFRLKENGFVL